MNNNYYNDNNMHLNILSTSVFYSDWSATYLISDYVENKNENDNAFKPTCHLKLVYCLGLKEMY